MAKKYNLSKSIVCFILSVLSEKKSVLSEKKIMENRTQKLTIRISQSETQALKQAAAAQNMNVSQLVRSIAQSPKNK